MEELTALLNGIEDSYYDFISAMLHYAKKKPSRMEALVSYIKEHPGIKSADVIEFVSLQKDFYEDAAQSSVG